MGGDDGEWDITLLTAVVGAGLSAPPRLAVIEGDDAPLRTGFFVELLAELYPS